MFIHQQYMRRCLELALKGAGTAAPNPMVGAVLVHDGRIIGEGWHKKYGEAHAEVNCLDSVKEEDKELIRLSTMYVSLEPCAHHGKTPPCADLIIRHKISNIVIGCRDPFPEVDGKGIEKLKAAGLNVVIGILEEECREMNKRFFVFNKEHRPYIVLKWAETADGNIGSGTKERILISNEYSNRRVHQWRGEESAILVGTNTALYDDPALTTRLYPGRSPVRMVIDMNLRLPSSLQLFNGEVRTIIFNGIKQEEQPNILYYKLEKNNNIISHVLKALYEMKIQSVMVEGGAILLQSFIDEGMWDEIRVIKNEKLIINNGVKAPLFTNAIKLNEEMLAGDKIEIYKRAKAER